MAVETGGAGAAPVTVTVGAAGADDLEEAEELLVEEISIDGMCGVY